MSTTLDTPKRAVLIVAGEFPPLKTIGRIRTTKFAEHLSSLGWRPVVLTLEASGNEPNHDAALLSEIAPGVEVIRVPLLTFEERIVGLAKRILGRGASNKPAAASSTADTTRATSAEHPSAPLSRSEKLQRRIKQWIRIGLDVPDSYLPWAFKATPIALRAAREHTIDVVFTTLPPFSAAYIGYRLKGATGIPWVADYRDLWYGDVLREWLPGWRRRLEFWMEKRLLRRVDAVVTVSYL